MQGAFKGYFWILSIGQLSYNSLSVSLIRLTKEEAIPILMGCQVALLWLLVVGLLTRRPGLEPRSSHVGFLADKVVLGQGFYPSTSISSANFHSSDCCTLIIRDPGERDNARNLTASTSGEQTSNGINSV
jgi:hypothetical protein